MGTPVTAPVRPTYRSPSLSTMADPKPVIGAGREASDRQVALAVDGTVMTVGNLDGGSWSQTDSAMVTITRGSNTTLALGDLDGAGDLDLLIGSDDAGLVLYRNQGSRTGAKFVLEPSLSLDVPPLVAPAPGDLDGDGRPELLLGTTGGGLLYYRTRAPGPGPG